MKSPEVIVKNQPIDIELCKLLGSTPADFLVLCFDGVQLDDFGTPWDTPQNRVTQQRLVESLNDRTAESRWPEMWRNWKPNICKQFGLPDTTTSDDYRPVVSFKISRVCPAYSEHLHAAIGLFETVSEKVETWFVAKNETEFQVEIVSKSGRVFSRTGIKPSHVIAETVCELLREKRDDSTR